MGDLDNLRHNQRPSTRWMTLSGIQTWEQRRVLIQSMVLTGDKEQIITDLVKLCRDPFATADRTISLLSFASALLYELLPPPRLIELQATAISLLNQPLASILTALAMHHVSPEQLKVETSKPLGFRKSLARTSDRNILARVRDDPHPSVLSIYLSNPNVTERDVVAVASKRPNYCASLLTIAKSASWVSRYAVRSALYFNPSLPLFAAAALGLSLRNRELETTKELGMSNPRTSLAATLQKLRSP